MNGCCMNFFIRYIWLLLFVAPPLQAMEVQPLESIREAVQLFLEKSVAAGQGETEVTVGQLDRRLRLARCAKPLDTSLPATVEPLGNITVSVSCEGPKPWSLLVQATVARFVEVVVAARPLARNLPLDADAIRLARVDVSQLRGGYYASEEEVAGQLMRRSVRAGTVLTNTMLKPPLLIKRGEKVIIHAKSGPIQVRMEGLALQAGALGEVIEVKNLSSSQVIEAVVVSPGVVRVRM